MAEVPVLEQLEKALAQMPEDERGSVRRLWACGAVVVASHADVIPGPGVTHVLVVTEGQPPRLVRKRVLI